MNFDPTIRLDFLIVAAGVLFYVARLEAKVASISASTERVIAILKDLESRVRNTELDVAHHLGNGDNKTPMSKQV